MTTQTMKPGRLAVVHRPRSTAMHVARRIDGYASTACRKLTSGTLDHAQTSATCLACVEALTRPELDELVRLEHRHERAVSAMAARPVTPATPVADTPAMSDVAPAPVVRHLRPVADTLAPVLPLFVQPPQQLGLFG